jgi:hypothetical protein
VNKRKIQKSGRFIINILIILFIPIQLYCQLAGSGAPGPSPGELMAESLHQAIGLEKLPEVTSLVNGDTIFVEVYDMIAGTDSIPDEILSTMLPRHIDKWTVKSIFENTIKLKGDDFYYLKMYVERDDDKFIVNLICQPNYEDFIDRGRLTLEFEYEDGVIKLISLSRWYG